MKREICPQTAGERLSELATTFYLTTVAAELVHRVREAGYEDVLPVLLEVFESEQEQRRQRRVERLRRASKLPQGKRFETLDLNRLPRLASPLRELANGSFLEQAVNVLAFGLPGTGKSHCACALGNALVEAGHSVLFTPSYKLVQDLLAAKRDLALPKALRKLDRFELLILDDIGYVQQDAERQVFEQGPLGFVEQRTDENAPFFETGDEVADPGIDLTDGGEGRRRLGSGVVARVFGLLHVPGARRRSLRGRR